MFTFHWEMNFFLFSFHSKLFLEFLTYLHFSYYSFIFIFLTVLTLCYHLFSLHFHSLFFHLSRVLNCCIYYHQHNIVHRTFHQNSDSDCYYHSNIVDQISIIVYLTPYDIIAVYHLSTIQYLHTNCCISIIVYFDFDNPLSNHQSPSNLLHLILVLQAKSIFWVILLIYNSGVVHSNS